MRRLLFLHEKQNAILRTYVVVVTSLLREEVTIRKFAQKVQQANTILFSI